MVEGGGTEMTDLVIGDVSGQGEYYDPSEVVRMKR